MARKMLSALLHIGQNMWDEEPIERAKMTPYLESRCRKDYLRCDEKVWRRITDRMEKRHYNSAVLDLGEGVIYPSHPELAVKGSWSPEKLQKEIHRLRDAGIEAIPKLNFATTHDTWLGEYHRMVSTPDYYTAVQEIIDDVVEIFETPRLFHIGMDEELMGTQKRNAYQCVRQGELLWQDYGYYFACLTKHGVRPLVWGDEATFHPEWFHKRMPKYVLQSKCHYGSNFVKGKQRDEFHERQLASLKEVSDAGYEQLPVSSNWVMKKPEEFPWPTGKDYPRDRTAIRLFTKHCVENIKDELLAGFLCAPWGEINADLEDYWLEAIDQQADAMAEFGLKV